MEPIWTLSTIITAPLFLLIAVALIAVGIWFAVDHFTGQKKSAAKYQKALERHQRFVKFAHEFKQERTAQKRAKVEQLAAASGVSVVDLIDSGRIDHSDASFDHYGTDKFEMMDAYNELGDDYDAYSDQNAPRPSYHDTNSDGLWVTFWTVLIGGVVATIVACSMYPYQAVYHQYRVVQGKVTQVAGEKLNGTDSGDIYLSYVFEINGKQYVCEEARCSTITAGSVAKLRCKPTYHRTGAPTNECSFVSVRKD